MVPSRKEMPDRTKASPRKRVPAVSGLSVSTSAFFAALKPSPSALAPSAWAMPRPIAAMTSMPPIVSIGSHIQFAMLWISNCPDPLRPMLT